MMPYTYYDEYDTEDDQFESDYDTPSYEVLASHFFENPQYDEYDEYFPQDNYYNNEFDDFIGGEFD